MLIKESTWGVVSEIPYNKKYIRFHAIQMCIILKINNTTQIIGGKCV